MKADPNTKQVQYEDPLKMSSQSKTIKKLQRLRHQRIITPRTSATINNLQRLNILFKDVIKENILKRNIVIGKEEQEDIKNKAFFKAPENEKQS